MTELIVKDCAICGVTFSRKPTASRSPKYCSRECTFESMRRQKESYKTIPKGCAHCGSIFLTDKWKAKTKKFCSKMCSSAHNSKYGNLIEVPCDHCGKAIRRNRADVRKSKRVYCGYDCMGAARLKAAPGTGKWENVRAWFGRNGRMKECVRCGYDEEVGILVVHHKDRNRDNNVMSNLEVLCPNCHALEHLGERREGWKHESNSYRAKRRRAESASRALNG